MKRWMSLLICLLLVASLAGNSLRLARAEMQPQTEVAQDIVTGQDAEMPEEKDDESDAEELEDKDGEPDVAELENNADFEENITPDGADNADAANQSVGEQPSQAAPVVEDPDIKDVPEDVSDKEGLDSEDTHNETVSEGIENKTGTEEDTALEGRDSSAEETLNAAAFAAQEQNNGEDASLLDDSETLSFQEEPDMAFFGAAVRALAMPNPSLDDILGWSQGVSHAFAGETITIGWDVYTDHDQVESAASSATWYLVDNAGAKKQIIKEDFSASGTSSITIPNAGYVSGYCDVFIKVTYTDGAIAEETYRQADFTILPTAEPEVTVRLNKDTVAVGETITATWSVTNLPYGWTTQSYFRIEDGINMGFFHSASTGASGESSFSPQFGTWGEFDVELLDEKGNSAKLFWSVKSFTITGGESAPLLEVVSLTPDKEETAIGSPIEVVGTVEGGVKPYRYTFTWWTYQNGVLIEKKEFESDEPRSSFAPTQGNSGQVALYVTDAKGRNASSHGFSFIIYKADANVTLGLDKTTVAIGKPITARWFAPNGLPEGWNVDLNWQVEDANGNGGMHVAEYGYRSSTLKPKYGNKGFVVLDVMDDSGNVVETYQEHFTITGDDNPAPTLEVTSSVSPASGTLGNPMVGTGYATGGRKPYVYYDYVWTIYDENDNVIDGFMESSDTPIQSHFTPTRGVRGDFVLMISDADGRYNAPIVSFTLTPPATPYIDIVLDKTNVLIGEPITATWQLVNAKPGDYTQAIWSFYDDNTGDYGDIFSDEQSSDTIIPKFGTRGTITVELVPAEGFEDGGSTYSVTKDFIITGSVSPEEALRIGSFVTPASAKVGEELTATWGAHGGTPPYTYEYMWFTSNNEEHDPDAITIESGPTEATKSTFRPLNGKRVIFFVMVTDSLGRIAHDGDIQIPLLPAVSSTIAPTVAPKPEETPAPAKKAAPRVDPLPPAPPPTVEELAQSIVQDKNSQAMPFNMTTHETGGTKVLIIAAAPVNETQEKTEDVVNWALNNAFVEAALAQGFETVTAKRDEISVVLDTAQLKNAAGQSTVVSIQKMNKEQYPEAVQQEMAQSNVLTQVYEVTITGHTAGQMVSVSFPLPEGAETASIVEYRSATGQVVYAETSITVDASGQKTVHAMVENGSMCFMKK